MDTLTRIKFARGDQVPEWLLALEPMHPQSVRAPVTFSMPTDVLDAGDYYVVVPRYVGHSPVGAYLTEATGCEVRAPTKPVETIMFKSVIVNTDYLETRIESVLTQLPPSAPAPGQHAVLEPVEQRSRQRGVVKLRPWQHTVAAVVAVVAGLLVVLGSADLVMRLLGRL